MKMNGEVNVYIHVFLTLALVWSGQLHVPVALTPSKPLQGIHWILDRRLSGPENRSERNGKEKMYEPNWT
jgi:hypothetical protein